MSSQVEHPEVEGCAARLVVYDAQSQDMSAVQGIYAWHVLHGLATFE